MADAIHPGEAGLREALRDIVEGRGVKRADHVLRGPNGDPCVPLFLEALQSAGYTNQRISEIPVCETERAPAWFVDAPRAQARFGWVFWERFAPDRARKLFGTVHKNAKGDWDLMLGERSPRPIYVRFADRIDCDPNNPSSW